MSRNDMSEEDFAEKKFAEKLLSLENLRRGIQENLDMNLIDSAIFLSEHLTTLLDCIYIKLLAHFRAGKYNAVIIFIERHKRLLEEKDDIRIPYLHAQCLIGDWKACEDVFRYVRINEEGFVFVNNMKRTFSIVAGELFSYEDGVETFVKKTNESKIHVFSAMCVLRGKVSSALGNEIESANWFRAALKADPWCYDAFRKLQPLLTSGDEVDVLYQLLRHQHLPGFPISFYSKFINRKHVIDNNLHPIGAYATAPIPAICDMENVGIPNKTTVSTYIGALKKNLATLGYTGKLAVTVVISEENKIPERHFNDLSCHPDVVEVYVCHSSAKQASDLRIQYLLGQLAKESNAPGNILVYAGDGGYIQQLRLLHNTYHNVMLVYQGGRSKKLRRIGYCQWEIKQFLKGELEV